MMARPQPSHPAGRPAVPTQPLDIRDAVVRTLAYSDLFDHPLTAREVHRYLLWVTARPEEVAAALEAAPGLTCRDGYHMLAGREHLVTVRRRRASVAADLWPHAERWGRILAALPFVRMVAVTGALAVDSVERGADVDYLIVARGGRVWLCRALVTAVARAAALSGVRLCPNYVLSEAALPLADRTLYVARELLQMVPLAGQETLARMRAANAWSEEFLPNASAPWPVRLPVRPTGSRVATLTEHALNGRIGDRLEAGALRWQTRRLARKMQRGELARGEAQFSADGFKGHYDAHGRRILSEWADRVRGCSP